MSSVGRLFGVTVIVGMFLKYVLICKTLALNGTKIFIVGKLNTLVEDKCFLSAVVFCSTCLQAIVVLSKLLVLNKEYDLIDVIFHLKISALIQ